MSLKIDSTRRAAEAFSKLSESNQEEFWLLNLNSELSLISCKMLFRGTVDSCPFHPRDLIREICLENASFFMISHNHPTGNAHPSLADIRITNKIIRIAKWIEVPLLDHLIVSRNSYFSFADHGLLKSPLYRKNISHS